MDGVRAAARSWDPPRIVLGVATWPDLQAVQKRLWGNRGLAVAAMTLFMILIVAAPIAAAVIGIADRTDDIIAWSRSPMRASVPPPPEWIAQIPLLGRKIAKEWTALASASSEDLFARGAPYLKALRSGGSASSERSGHSCCIFCWR